jgi:hypothetical protein
MPSLHHGTGVRRPFHNGPSQFHKHVDDDGEDEHLSANVQAAAAGIELTTPEHAQPVQNSQPATTDKYKHTSKYVYVLVLVSVFCAILVFSFLSMVAGAWDPQVPQVFNGAASSQKQVQPPSDSNPSQLRPPSGPNQGQVQQVSGPNQSQVQPVSGPNPSPPGVQMPLSSAQIVASLNERFRYGRPSNDLEAAGVLVRQFGSTNNGGRPWEPCQLEPRIWCSKYHAQWPASIINDRMRHTYYQGRGGLVLQARHVHLFCAYSSDGNSMAHHCDGTSGDGSTCIPGCYPASQQCHEVHKSWDCSWPPDKLQDALEAQLRRSNPASGWNEMVVDTKSIEVDPVSTIAAFFYLKGASNHTQWGMSNVEQQRQRFIQTFQLSSANAPPLVQLNLHAANWSAVFSLRS